MEFPRGPRCWRKEGSHSTPRGGCGSKPGKQQPHHPKDTSSEKMCNRNLFYVHMGARGPMSTFVTLTPQTVIASQLGHLPTSTQQANKRPDLQHWPISGMQTVLHGPMSGQPRGHHRPLCQDTMPLPYAGGEGTHSSTHCLKRGPLQNSGREWLHGPSRQRRDREAQWTKVCALGETRRAEADKSGEKPIASKCHPGLAARKGSPQALPGTQEVLNEKMNE